MATMLPMDSKEIFGAEIQYFRLEPEYWEKIILHMKNAGLRCVTTYVQWSTHIVGGPDADHPAGIFDFEGKTDPKRNLLRFLELVEKHGLNLNFRCGPFCCNEMVHGGYPSWLVLGDPDMMVWDYQNRMTKGYWIARHEGSQPSYLHPDYLRLCDAWIGEVDKIIVPHLKKNGGCITMINLDNEVSYIVQDGFLTSDYNPVNVKPGGYYHQFLQQKYGSIDKLPYEGDYADFNAIPAPRSVPDMLDSNLAYYLDWCEFKQWVMAEYIRRLRLMHESNGVSDVIFMTNFNPHLPEGVPTRMPAFEEAAGGLAGYDFYRGTFMSYSGYHSMARVLKLMNASLKYTYSPEFMSGTWIKVLDTRVSDDHMRFMARCALAHGCKSMNWFMFHDRECWGDSPVSSHGHPRPSLQVLKETPELLFERIKGWDSLVPQGDTAIIYDLVQHRHTYLGDPSPCADNELHIGKPSINGVQAGKASKEYFGLFRLIEQAGYQAHVVDIMHSGKVHSRYPLVFLPGSPVIEREAAVALQRYVQQGGTVVISGPWPARDENGRELRFMEMDKPEACTGDSVFAIGSGKLLWRRDFIAQEDPEEESLGNIEWVCNQLESHVGEPHVRIAAVGPVRWVDWVKGGGCGEYVQPRTLGSAVLQVNDTEAILFVMNHYPEAAKFELVFKDKRYSRLVNLDTHEMLEIHDGRLRVDIDRKYCEIYRVE